LLKWQSENARIVALPDVIEKPNALGVERVADSPEKFGPYRALGRHHPQVKPEGSTGFQLKPKPAQWARSFL
jgi:hypothetical protein